ncbi:glycosyltransferase family 4 protein [Candidatus Electrothrix sp.]|uniref:glycosyltransferase family 4 protein n=1 Tax=Candidatus Electrothrix sp. TaxID=2170559 RepID=UPI004056D469
MNSNRVWGGGEKWHYETACYLDELGYSILVVTNKNSDLYNKLKDRPSIEVTNSAISNIGFLNPFKLRFLKRLFQKHEVYALILGLSIDVKLGGPAAKLAGVKHIIYRRGSAVPVKNSLMNRFLFCRVLTKIITNSSEIKQNIFKRNENIIEDEKVMVMYNGVDLTHWPPLDYFSSNGEQKRVLSLGNAGRLVEQKGQEYLIRIAGMLKSRNIPFQLMIAGSGKLERALKSQCKRLGLEEEVIFLDFVEDIRDFLKGLDIYLSTSLHEGSSHVILEAMAAGKPVVAFNISSMPEMIDDGKSGYLIPFGDVQLFTEKIAHLWSHPSEMDQTGNLARKQVEERFDFHANLQQLIQLIGNA